MDPSIPSAQDVTSQNSSDQSAGPVQQSTVQPPTQPAQTPPQQQTVTISGNKEGPPAVIITESPDADDEDEIQPAKQETKTQVVQQGAAAEVQDIEVRPSIPEVTIEKSVESVIEKSPDQEKPDIKAIEDAGVTHSGPGIIAVESTNTLGIPKMPQTYQQAAVEEKETKLHDSKHWLSGLIKYIWRKVNPKLGKKGVTN